MFLPLKVLFRFRIDRQIYKESSMSAVTAFSDNCCLRHNQNARVLRTRRKKKIKEELEDSAPYNRG